MHIAYGIPIPPPVPFPYFYPTKLSSSSSSQQQQRSDRSSPPQEQRQVKLTPYHKHLSPPINFSKRDEIPKQPPPTTVLEESAETASRKSVERCESHSDDGREYGCKIEENENVEID